MARRRSDLNPESKLPVYEHIEEDPLLSAQIDLTAAKPSEIQRGLFANWLRDDIGERLVKAERKSIWMVPLAISAGLVLAVAAVFIYLAEQEYIQPEKLQSMVEEITQDKGAENARKQDPQLWLTYISGLLRAGHVQEANREMRAFRQQYPEYKKPR